MALFPKYMGVMEQSLRAANLRHQVTANNIANVNVPGYQAVEVSFEEQLRSALAARDGQTPGLQGLVAHQRHIPIGSTGQTEPHVVQPGLAPSDSAMRPDGNNVDIEQQMAKLAANQLWYQGLVRSVSDEFNRLRIAITEGRR